MMQLCREQAGGRSSADRKTIGPYIIKQNLGQGTTGTVRLAYNTETGGWAAVKIVNKTVTRKRKEALKELSVLRGVDYEHVIKLVHVEEDPVNMYLFTEYYEEGDMYAYIQKHGVFDETTAKSLFRQMVDAVDCCHKELRVCHHDIKLENLVINSNFHIKLIDFGFAVALESATKKLIKVFDGSPAYSPLEVLMKRPHDESVDIYSLGICLYYMLCGVFPFCGDKTTLEELCTNVQSQKLSFPDKLSEPAKDLLRRLLSPRQSRLTCEEIRVHLWFSTTK